jgi:hypothetical protein
MHMARSGRKKRDKRKQRRVMSKQERARQSLVRHLGGEQKAAEFLEKEGSRRSALEVRRKALESDPIFDGETDKLQKDLRAAYSYNPEVIDAFFQRFWSPAFFNFQEARALIKTLPPAIQEVLNSYIKHASRFGVYFVRRNQQFEWRVLPPPGWKFQAHQVGGRLAAVGPASSGEAAVDHMESPDLPVPKEIQGFIDSHEVKFLRIDDETGSSVLNDVESFGYHADGVTLIHHNAERPYLFCLYGENVSKESLDRVGKAITAFQRENYGRGKAGRRADVARRRTTRELLAQPGRMKEKAGEVMTTDKIQSSQSYVSRVRNEKK